MEIPINKDLRNFKTKDIGNFTLKEAGFIALAGIAAIISYKLQKTAFGEIKSPLLMLLPAVPFIILGFLKPFGLSFTTFMQTIYVEKYKMGKILYWESDFVVTPDIIEDCFGEEYVESVFPSSEISAISPTEDVTAPKKKKKKRKKGDETDTE